MQVQILPRSHIERQVGQRIFRVSCAARHFFSASESVKRFRFPNSHRSLGFSPLSVDFRTASVSNGAGSLISAIQHICTRNAERRNLSPFFESEDAMLELIVTGVIALFCAVWGLRSQR